MKYVHKLVLEKELRQAGAEPAEIVGLLGVAGQVSRLKENAPVVPNPRPLRARLLPLGVTAAVFLVVGAGLVMLAQSAMPGAALYPVQKLSDNVAMSVNANYRSTLMLKRMSSMTWLIDHHAGNARVLAAITDYRSVAAGYRVSGQNYEVLSFCHDSLQQASAQTSGQVHQAVVQALHSLDT